MNKLDIILCTMAAGFSINFIAIMFIIYDQKMKTK